MSHQYFGRLQPASSASAALQNHLSPAAVSIFTESYPLLFGEKKSFLPCVEILPLMLHVLRGCLFSAMLATLGFKDSNNAL